MMSDNSAEIPKLIACTMCGENIATSAAICPKCGAPNNWRHPEIVRFEKTFQSKLTPPFNITWNHFILQGNAEVKRRGDVFVGYGLKAFLVGIPCFVLSMILGLSSDALAFNHAYRPLLRTSADTLLGIAGVVGAVGMILLTVTGLVTLLKDLKNPATGFVSFTVDFSKTPPEWRSTDDKFWKEVKEFFFPAEG